MEHSKKYLIRHLFSVAAMSLLVLSGTARAGGNEHASREMQFAVLMDGPITINESGDWSADLYSIDGAKFIGRMVRQGGQAGCLSFPVDVPPPPFVPACENPPALSPGQFYYERHVVTFEFPGGTLIGSLRGWEAFTANPPVHGGIKSGAAVEDGEITGGTGIYQHVRGRFFSRISDEFQTIVIFGYSIDAPIWFNKSIVVFTLKKGN